MSSKRKGTQPFVSVCSSHSHLFSPTEEGQTLLGGQESDSDDEVLMTGGTADLSGASRQQEVLQYPPPSYSAPQQATLTPTPLTSNVPMAAATPHLPLPPADEPPPDYFLHEPKDPHLAGKAGLAVQIQIDGKLVPGTVMEDVSGFILTTTCCEGGAGGHLNALGVYISCTVVPRAY